MNTRYFRAGVGTVIYTPTGQIALFKRAQYPVGVWQFQQGGIDLEEDAETTLWRELREEIGLTKDDFSDVHEMPFWTVHQEQVSLDDPSKSRMGQAHRWFFLQLKETSTIDLNRASEKEASDWQWTDFATAIAETEPLKKHVYQQLEAYFSQFVVSVH